MILRLAHVCLATPDLERLLAFYGDVLGAELIHTFRKEDGTRYGVFLHLGGGTFLEVFTGPAEVREDAALRHFCLEVADIQEAAARLERSGQRVLVRQGRTDRVWLCEARDPDGRLLEFHQYIPESVQYPYTPERK